MHLRSRNIKVSSTTTTPTSSPKKHRRSPRLREKTEQMRTTPKPTGRRADHIHPMVLRSHV